MIKTLYVRIIFTFLVVIIFSLLSSFLIGLFLFKKEVNHIGQNDMIAAGEEMIRLYEQTHPEDREAFIKSMVKISTYPIHLYDVSGNVTYYDLDNTETVQIAPEVVQMVLQGQVYRSPAEVDQTFIGLPFPFEGEPQAVFMQFSPQNENIINRMVFLILLLALFIGSLCIFIAARYLVRPIQVLTRATKQLAKGDFDVEIQTKRVDEMGALTHSFNEMASELKQLEQMRQDFVSNVSHEIQTPLTSISGFAMAMKNSSLVAEADRNYYLDIIITESGRLSRLSDNLLELASLDSDHHPFEAATYNLDEQIRQIIVTCEPQWSTKNIQVHLELAEPIQVTADRDQLNQVWMNLLGNSIKFTPAGGHIHIRTHQVENKILITITDTGIGIAPEQLDYVFDRFYKTDLSRNRSISGNGLGLAIVKKIVMIHHGTVEIQSQEGEGTTVLVHLPLA
ncbi:MULTISPECIES: HAMP domain-containing sensor histidine kinase [unclassified Paenibacillus]|uniref:HAMP domain-containing sensor histidine kinase n=1 Tax=unclassified Paenibacillus TaxID=185978 RepID=UPI0008AF4E14|nr:HAMP domain-containing sensor histidine kinase [Paenibacillus sp. OK076]SEP22621.1 Signal transduction histidine kinase [Paenibacillus sp. OK076]